ncbi:hypothetical protein JHK82_012862 [Glycine max]|nr:hypothetical protein JHK82_012862 [Glycine max]
MRPFPLRVTPEQFESILHGKVNERIQKEYTAATTSSFSTCMALFFSLLLLSHFTMAILEHNIFSPSTSNKEGVKKRNTKVVASVREESEQNSKKDMALGETSKGSIHVPKREHSQHSQSPNRIFNASAHEVPSGPNPISNR